MFLHVRFGAQAGRKIRLIPSHPVRIGRTNGADIFFPDDSHMSGLHFRVEWVGEQCRVSDLNSRNGSFLNGKRIAAAVLNVGDTLVAGETKFSLTVEAPAGVSTISGSAPTAEMPGFIVQQTSQDRLLDHLRNDAQPLFAVLDAARDTRILGLLLHHKEQSQSLYDGDNGVSLAQVAPYLVRLVKESALLKSLVREGRGKNWGIYLTSDQGFEQIRRHLRHFLQIRLGGGEQVYFRFYDPRVMRVFLPNCGAEDTTRFFGPIQSYLLEDETAHQLLRFVNTGAGSQQMLIPLADPDQVLLPSRTQDEGARPPEQAASVLQAAAVVELTPQHPENGPFEEIAETET